MLFTPQGVRSNGRLLRPRGVNLCLPTVGPDSAKDAIQRIGAILCSLGIHSFAHDRTPTSEDLEIGHGSSTGRNMTSAGGEGSKGGGRCLVEEGTHGTGLSEESFHGEEWDVVC